MVMSASSWAALPKGLESGLQGRRVYVRQDSALRVTLVQAQTQV